MSAGSTTKAGLGFALGQQPNDGITKVCWGGEAGGSELLLASSWDSSVRLYDPQAAVSSGNPDGALRAVFSGEAAVLDCAFVDGTHGVSGSLDQKVVMYNFRNNSKELVGEHEGKAVRCVAVSNSGTSILSGGWDKKVLAWDLRTPSKGSMGRSPVAKAEVDGKVFSMSLCQAGAGIDGTAAAAGGGGDGEWSRLIVGTSGRKVYVFDRRDLSKPVQVRDSPLKSQTRCITALPRGAGFVIGSTGGRVAVEYFLTPGETKPRKKFAFKTHRVKSADGKTEMVFPVNTVCYHPVHGTFATGGGDGIYNIWDGDQKKRLYQSTKYPTSISSLAFSQSGKMLAVASSYTFEQGEKDHPPDTIYIRELEDSKVMPKAKRKASA